jgi:hypothetical protein
MSEEIEVNFSQQKNISVEGNTKKSKLKKNTLSLFLRIVTQ